MLVHPLHLPMQEPFQVSFSNGSAAVALKPQHKENLKFLLRQLGLYRSRPTLVIVGGASRLSQEDMEKLRALFVKVLAPLAEAMDAYVIDGGTDAGVMQMMGHARTVTGATFPLVGVVPIGVATLPNQEPPCEDAAPLEPHHTHFMLVPGSKWGDESPWIAELASALTNGLPSVTVLINGGEITWQDAAASVGEKRPIVVIAGSGRTADILVSALHGNLQDDRAGALVSSGLLQAVNLTNFDTLAAEIQQLLSAQNSVQKSQKS